MCEKFIVWFVKSLCDSKMLWGWLEGIPTSTEKIIVNYTAVDFCSGHLEDVLAVGDGGGKSASLVHGFLATVRPSVSFKGGWFYY